MKLIHYTEAESKRFEGGPADKATGRVLIGKADGADKFVMRSFELEPGGYTPFHAHDWEHEFFVHSGKGEVTYEGEQHPVTTGTAVFVPPGHEHQIRNTGDEMLVFICLIPVGPPEL